MKEQVWREEINFEAFVAFDRETRPDTTQLEVRVMHAECGIGRKTTSPKAFRQCRFSHEKQYSVAEQTLILV